MEMQEAMAAIEYEGYSDDETVRVVFSGNLELLRCDITEAAKSLGTEAVSQRVTEAVVDAHGQVLTDKREKLRTSMSNLGMPFLNAEQRWKSAVAATASLAIGGAPLAAMAANEKGIDPFFQFQPVCPASDGVFRSGQQAALLVAGNDNIEDYRPLINDVLIRVRTELCVLESFTRETAVPFVQSKGLGWVFPLHETSETYLAGVVFMIGTNFILLGSTKVLAILAIYHDLVIGLPTRLLARLLGLADGGKDRFDKEIERTLEKQNAELSKVMMDKKLDAATRTQRTSDLSAEYAKKLEEIRERSDAAAKKRDESSVGQAAKAASVAAVPLRFYGIASEKVKQLLEGFDTFCSRYFIALTVFYVIAKTLHYVVFPNALDGLGRG
eukprot:gnl/TRDRNA2_/TRDRNA2_89871_c1_seq1.p1 gnl/TRDRNA2_/TRDRNA2_89871_c1~~gnl/TRDRNA2_/TRDRNA2_89871_c1_seq1.p1  ORF type:complete len:384 (-),score=86.23 gnl/TRDRNA2_/TRDRNA2_89871_c1_seq1:81-1232(-)